MAGLECDRSGNFLVRFRWAGKPYKRSLDTRDAAVAEAGAGRVDETLMRLKRGWLTMPEHAEPGIFIISGGALTGKPVHTDQAPPVTIGQLLDAYRTKVTGKDSGTMRTIRIHQNHVARILGTGTAVAGIGLQDAQRYCDRRASERWHGKTTSAYTIRKELRTFRRTWEWGVGQGIVEAPKWEMRSLELGSDQGREPFRTAKEIIRRIERGGLDAAAQSRLWECLYLTSDEIREVLEHVRVHATSAWLHPMLCFVVCTGARRSEALRSQIDDWDFGNGIVHIRERKRDTSKDFTMRGVDIHPMLADVMKAWFAGHPGGQMAICREDGTAVTTSSATDHLNRTLARSGKWANVPGYHTFRHSFASVLAAKGVDQRVIDALMGHQTEEMRKRYQHLFPKSLSRAIDGLLS